MSSAAAFKKSLSETFAQLAMPPALDQMAPEVLATLIRTPDPSASLRIVDVRQPDEFSVGHVASSVNQPVDSFHPEALVAAVAEDIAAGLRPTVVFASSQSPDIDSTCALSFAHSWEELGLDVKTGVAATSIAVTLLGGVCYWLQTYRADETLTSAYDPAKWETTLAALNRS